MAEDIISNTKAWFTLTPAQQKAVTRLAFEDKFVKSKNSIYEKASPASKARIEKAFTRVVEEGALASEYNPSNQRKMENQNAADSGNWLFNLGSKIKDSHVDAVNRAALIPDALNPDGVASQKFASTVANVIQKRGEKAVTDNDRRLVETLTETQKKIDQAGGFWTLGGLKAAASSLPEIAANPIGALGLAADSMSSATIMGMGAWGGAKTGAAGGAAVGSAVPGIGTATGTAAGATIGSIAGMATGETADAATSKLIEIFEKKAKEQGLPPTESTFTALAEDPAFVKNAQQTAMKYASTLAAADTAIGFGLSRFATSPVRSAIKNAKTAIAAADQTALATAAKATGVSVEKFTERLVNRKAAAAMKAQTVKAQLARAGTHYTGEVLSEPITEATATAAIGEENNFTNLMSETLGGVGTGPITMAIDKAAFGSKLVADKVANTAKTIMASTPETKAAAAERSAVIANTQKLAQAPAEADYKRKVAEINPTDETFATLSDPSHVNYNPIKAMDVLAKNPDPEAHTKAMDILVNHMNSAAPYETRWTELQAKAQTEEGLNPIEHKEASDLKKLLTSHAQINNKLFATFDSIAARTADTVKTAAPDPSIDTKTASASEIVQVLGSRGTRLTDKFTTADIDAILQRQDLDSGTKALVSTHKDAASLRQAIETVQPQKSVLGVSEDIYSGKAGSSFKGVDAYKQGMQYYLSSGNTDKAQAELDGLKRFSQAHENKRVVITDLFNAYKDGGIESFSPEQQATYASLRKENPNFFIGNGTVKLVDYVSREASALKKEVKLAEMTFKALSGQTDSTTQPVTQKPATEVVTTPPDTKSVVESQPVAQPTVTTVATPKPAASTTPTFVAQTPWSKKVSEIEVGDEARLTAQQAQELVDAHGDGTIQRITNRNIFATGSDAGKADYGHRFGFSNNKAVRGITSFFTGDPNHIKEVKLDNEATDQDKSEMLHYSVRPIDVGGEFIAVKNDDGSYYLYSDTAVDTTKASVVSQGAKLKSEYDAIKKAKEGTAHELKNVLTSLDELAALGIEINPQFSSEGTAEDQGQSGGVGESTARTTREDQPAAEVVAQDPNSPIDVLADYDIDHSQLLVTFTDANGQEQTMSYSEAMAENQLKLKEAEDVMRCIRS